MQLAFGRIGGGLIWVGAAAAGERQPLVINAHTGLALSGFDPVAYFTDSKPEFGWPDLKLRREGAVWRFRNEGDRAAFADHSEGLHARLRGLRPGRGGAR